MLGQNEENFHKSPISKPIPNFKSYLINQIVKKPRTHHKMASPLQTSFLGTKKAEDKHNVPGSQKKHFSLSDIQFIQT